jgi:hypothetical protein
MNIRPVGPELFHADGRTDRHDEANSGFSHYCEQAKSVFVQGYHNEVQCQHNVSTHAFITNQYPPD